MYNNANVQKQKEIMLCFSLEECCRSSISPVWNVYQLASCSDTDERDLQLFRNNIRAGREPYSKPIEMTKDILTVYLLLDVNLESNVVGGCRIVTEIFSPFDLFEDEQLGQCFKTTYYSSYAEKSPEFVLRIEDLDVSD